MNAVPSTLLTIFIAGGLMLLVSQAHGEDSTALIGLALGITAALLYRTRFHLDQLRKRLDALERQRAATTVSQTEQAGPVREPAAAPAARPAAAEPTVPVASAKAAAPPPPVALPAGEATATVMPPVASAPQQRPSPPREQPIPPTAVDRALAAFTTWLKSGNPLARAGVVILFFGGSFLAKYAADHSLFPIELRMAAIALGTLALLGVGWRLRSTRPLYAQTLQGGGIAGFYLTVFASTRLYQLLPHGLALGLMIVVALASAILAVAQNALALAVIGSGGGFLAPLLLSTGGGSLAALFTYYTVLNLGIFTVAWFRAWRVLNWVGFVFTFGVAGLFRGTAYHPDQQPTMEFFLWLFFLLYFAVSILFSIRQKPELRGYVSASLVFGLPLAVFGLHASVIGHEGFGLAWTALGLALFYLAVAYGLIRTRSDNLKLLAEAFAALGVIFGTLAIPLGFDRQSTALAWAIEGAGLVWLGLRQDRALARWFGLALQLVAGLAYVSYDHVPLNAWPVLNGAFVGTVAIAVAGLLSGWWVFRSDDRHMKGLDTAAAFWAAAWWLGGGAVEIQRFAPDYVNAGHLGLGTLSVALLALLSRYLGWRLLLWMSLGLLPLSDAAGLLAALDHHHPFADWAWISWLALLACGYWLLYRWPQDESAWPTRVAAGLNAGGLWLLVLIAAWEADWQVRQVIGGIWPALPWALVPAAALWCLSWRPLRPAWPLARHEDTYRVLAAWPLAAVGTLWILAINLLNDGDPVELVYVPLLNPLDLAVVLTTMALAAWWHSLDTGQRARLIPEDPRVLPGLSAALLFVWLNAALIRALHYGAGTPLSLDSIADSIVVQAALSMLWAATGFITIIIAARRQRRDAWLVGAGLMALMVAKLFLVDTAGRGTMARIASFLVAGLLLLIAGYVSPLPPRRELPQESGT